MLKITTMNKRKLLLPTILLSLLSCIGCIGQSRYPDVHSYDDRFTSLGNLWFYVERVDKAVDSLSDQFVKVDFLSRWQHEQMITIAKLTQTVDSLMHELHTQKMLLQINTDMGNYYIRKVDTLLHHRSKPINH
jgi:hypothetical protein